MKNSLSKFYDQEKVDVHRVTPKSRAKNQQMEVLGPQA